MQAGKLRNYITIQQNIPIQNENLEWIDDWSTFTQCWVSIEPLIGREYWASRQVNAETTGKIRMRYISGITTKMKVIDGPRSYNIEAVIDVENRHKELVLLVKENS
jgi:SPP1 family predicted phage head-tail adaptor